MVDTPSAESRRSSPDQPDFGLADLRAVLGDASVLDLDLDNNRLRAVFGTNGRVGAEDVFVTESQLHDLAAWSRDNDIDDVRVQVSLAPSEQHPFPPQAQALRDAGFAPRVFADQINDVVRVAIMRCGIRGEHLVSSMTDQAGLAVTRVLHDVVPLPFPQRSALVRDLENGATRVRSVAELTSSSAFDPTVHNETPRFIRSSSIAPLLAVLNIGDELTGSPLRLPTDIDLPRNATKFFDAMIAEGVTEWQLQLDDTTPRLHAHGAERRLEPLRTAFAESWVSQEHRIANAIDSAGEFHPAVQTVHVVGTVPIFAYDEPAHLDTPATPVVRRGMHLDVRMHDGRTAVVVVPDSAESRLDRIVELIDGIASVAVEFPNAPIAPTAVCHLAQAEGVHWSAVIDGRLKQRVHIYDRAFVDDTTHISNVSAPREAALGLVLDTDERNMNPDTDRSLVFQFAIHEHMHAVDRFARFSNPEWEPRRGSLVTELLGDVGDLGGIAVVNELTYFARHQPSVLDDMRQRNVGALPPFVQRVLAAAHTQTEIAGLYSTTSPEEAIAELGVVGIAGTRNRDVGRQLISALRTALDAPTATPHSMPIDYVP